MPTHNDVAYNFIQVRVFFFCVHILQDLSFSGLDEDWFQDRLAKFVFSQILVNIVVVIQSSQSQFRLHASEVKVLSFWCIFYEHVVVDLHRSSVHRNTELATSFSAV